MLLKACLNGRRTKSEHPKVPVTAGELARDAKRCFEAGAGAVHFHPRNAEGKETLDPRVVLLSVNTIRNACPNLPIGVTTAEWIDRSEEERLHFIERWEDPRPDFASVNFWEAQASQVCELLDLKGIGIEAGLATVEDAKKFAESNFPKKVVRVLVEVEKTSDKKSAVEICSDMVDVVEEATSASILCHGFERTAWEILEWAASKKRFDLRIGLEDTLQFPNGEIASDNSALVKEAARIAKSYRNSSKHYG